MFFFFNHNPLFLDLLLILLLLPFFSDVANNINLAASSSPPPPDDDNKIIRIGALLDLSNSGDDSVGLQCWDALQLALMNVNANPLLLNTSKLQIVPADSNCSAFTGAAAAMSLFQSEVVAIAGPQSSEVSHFVAHMAALTQVPLVSFSATDPSLSEYQYPYFIRLAWSDSIQMSAIAALIHYYGWREAVALYIDDDYGQNGVEALRDLLDNMGSKLTFKASLAAGADNQTITDVLTHLASMECRVFVVHMHPSMARTVFLAANRLQMMTMGYVWIVTDSITEFLNSNERDVEFRRATLGVIGLRMYIPESLQLFSFLKQRNQETGRTDFQYHAYELLAYESVWMISYALDRFLKQGNSLSFVNSSSPSIKNAGTDLAGLKVLKDGDILLSHVQATNFSGVTGFVNVNKRGDAEGITFEIVNMVDIVGLQVVGYWIKDTGCTLTPPSHSFTATADGKNSGQGNLKVVHNTVATTNTTSTDQFKLKEVMWPGNSTKIPRGWVLPENGTPLSIGVPNKTGYTEFVTTMVDAHGNKVFRGFCIDVFENATLLLPYAIKYKYVSFGNGSKTPNYNELIDRIAAKEFDAVVGDVTITTARSKLVDFTQPFTTSGLVVIVPIKEDAGSYAWAFMRPFTPAMWCTTGGFFLLTGLLIWMLEHKKNRHFRGRPQKQIVTTLWFIFSTLFFSHRENVKSTLGRAVLVIWLFVVLIITSSYTASLTSILTVEQLSPTIRGISGLIASDVPIGYQRGSFVEDYLLQLNVAKGRLVPLDTLTSYDQALKKGPSNGGVGAIVDELPYVQLLLSSECAAFAIAGQEFTKSGWGFAFPKGSQLAIDISTAILELSETGKLQQMHDKWLSNKGCISEQKETLNVLNLGSFWGLFLITGVASVSCVTCYIIRMIWEYKKRTDVADPPPSDPNTHGSLYSVSRFRRGTSFLKALLSFIEEAEMGRDENQSGRGSNGITSKDRSPTESRNTSMSIRSTENSARDSMASADDAKTELRQLVKDLSFAFKNNARRSENGTLTINDAKQEENMIISQQDNQIDEGSISTSSSANVSVMLRQSSGSRRKLLQRRSRTFKSIMDTDNSADKYRHAASILLNSEGGPRRIKPEVEIGLDMMDRHIGHRPRMQCEDEADRHVQKTVDAETRDVTIDCGSCCAESDGIAAALESQLVPDVLQEETVVHIRSCHHESGGAGSESGIQADSDTSSKEPQLADRQNPSSPSEDLLETHVPVSLQKDQTHVSVQNDETNICPVPSDDNSIAVILPS